MHRLQPECFITRSLKIWTHYPAIAFALHHRSPYRNRWSCRWAFYGLWKITCNRVVGRVEYWRFLGTGIAYGRLGRRLDYRKSTSILCLYIHSDDGHIEIRDATHLWGEDTYRVQELIKGELGDSGVRVLGIGPAGEALIPFALLLCDHGRVAGRTGLGAVMGSKNLKAIAVRGRHKIPVGRPGAFIPLRSEANRDLKNDSMSRVLFELGTAGAADYFDYLGEMPKKYFTSGVLENSQAISGSSIAGTILTGKSACHACVIACGRVVSLGDGEKRKGPEYETLAGFGANLGITDTHAITRMGELCDRYGMDTISTSGTIGLAFRLFELGIISTKDTGGLQLTWGNSQAASQLIHLIVHREGFGEFLAEGSLALARRFGVEEEAMQVNGLEIPYHDPRGASGMAIVYATSPRGACHNQSDYFLVEIGQTEIQDWDRVF